MISKSHVVIVRPGDKSGAKPKLTTGLKYPFRVCYVGPEGGVVLVSSFKAEAAAIVNVAQGNRQPGVSPRFVLDLSGIAVGLEYEDE